MGEEQYNSEDLLDFLQALDNSDVEVTDWEAKFIASNLDAISFSPAQKAQIRVMIQQYGKRIGWL